jgi:ATP-dependent 26S proteasome regulatory subunit
MNTTATNNWQEANQRYLMASLAVVREALQHHVRNLEVKTDNSGEVTAAPPDNNQSQGSLAANLALQVAAAALPSPSALQHLCTTFNLSSFERDVLLLCAGIEFDNRFASLCATANNDRQATYATFSLATAVLPTAHWSAIAPGSPLRRWRLIEVGRGNALSLSPLRIDERVLHYIAGVPAVDERLMAIVEPLSVSGVIVPSHWELAERVAATWSQSSPTGLPIVQLCGEDVTSKRAIASSACQLVGLNLYVMSARAISANHNELHDLMQVWEREAALSQAALLLDCDELELGGDAAKESAIARLIEGSVSPLIVSTRDRRRMRLRPAIAFDVRQPTAPEQRAIWQNVLGERAVGLNGQVEVLVSNFNLTLPTIHAVCAEVLSGVKSGAIATEEEESIQTNNPSLFNAQSSALTTALWDSCRAQARPRLEDLAQRLNPGAKWDDLVLPETQRQTLRDIASHVRQRSKVYESWGFAGKGDRGLGISALFAGSSGTGKTMAADVLAGELRLDLYRIDLSSVVSKYIGETEKNLRRIFDAAEAGGTILLFDEADALFGKRSEVKDSHDRHANIEVSYLLQRMEAYQGLAILTTNLKDSLDTAFLRRIRFVVKFAFPDATQRAEIWQRIFPGKTPTDNLDFAKLARLNVAGGNIRNIALNSAFIAADANEPVGMKHILAAAKSEYVKLERTLTDAEVKGWV